MKLSPKALGLTAAVVTVLIWSSFIVVARASAAHSLLPLDIGFLRIIGAGCVLLPWGCGSCVHNVNPVNRWGR